MRLQPKSISKVTLVNLLRRKRSSLRKFLTDNGIVTYELLTTRCNSMGVVPPTRDEFDSAVGAESKYQVSSPTEGIVVLEPVAANVELKQLDEDETFESLCDESSTNTAQMNEKKKKKRAKNF